MLPKNYGTLLFNAVRETLETMAFAEVVPCSFQIGDQEFTSLDSDAFEIQESHIPKEWGEDPVQTDFSQKEQSNPEDGWGTASQDHADLPHTDAWGSPGSGEAANDDWGSAPAAESDGGGWGMSAPTEEENDPWGESVAATGPSPGFTMQTRDIDFNSLVENQDDWCWSCMRVNSPEIHSIWFVVSKSLALELARNMYAGENLELDSPIIRDLVAELTNVLGGRLMLLLEEMGGRFTLTVPEIGIGLPKMPDASTMETVLCKVLVDGEYPVMSSICFNK